MKQKESLKRSVKPKVEIAVKLVLRNRNRDLSKCTRVISRPNDSQIFREPDSVGFFCFQINGLENDSGSTIIKRQAVKNAPQLPDRDWISRRHGRNTS